jgi:Zn-dependent protease with chaperone function
LRAQLLFALLLGGVVCSTALSADTDPTAENLSSQGVLPVEVPEPTPRAVAFYKSGHALWVMGQAWSLAIPLTLLLCGFSARMRDFAFRQSRRWLLAGAIFLVLYMAASALCRLPLAYYAGFVRAHQYGLSRQALGDWAGDELKAFAVGLLVSVPAILVVYGLILRSPRFWWLWCGLLMLPVLFCLVLVKPIWFDPLFNRFGPMRDKGLEARILALAHRAGIDADRVFEVDMSRKTSAINAYVTGLWGTQRIVLWDTLLAKLEPEQALCVMGHEMGHYALGHVRQGVLVGAALVTMGLGLVHVAATRLVRRLPRRARVERLSDFASLPLLVALGHLANLALTPAGFAYSRQIECEADRFALELTGDNYAAATAFVRLQQENLGYPRPGPLYMFWRSTHPSLAKRIEFCNNYRPWMEGRPLRYAAYFRSAAHAPEL